MSQINSYVRGDNGASEIARYNGLINAIDANNRNITHIQTAITTLTG